MERGPTDPNLKRRGARQPVACALLASTALVAAALLPGAARAQEGPFVYVPYAGGLTDWASIIDIPTNTVLPGPRQIADLQGSYAAVRPDQSLAYLSAQSSSIGGPRVSVIDSATNTEVATIRPPTGIFQPVGLALNPDATRLYVADRLNASVLVFDTATNTMLTAIFIPTSGPSGAFLDAVAVSPDGQRVYVGDQNHNTVRVIDTATNAVTGSIQLGNTPWSMVAGATRLYIATAELNTGTGGVRAIDIATNATVAIINMPVGPIGLALSPDGTRLYAAGETTNAVSVIDTATNAVVATVGVGGVPVGVAVSPDGTRVYLTSFIGNSVSVIDTGTNTVIATFPVGDMPVHPGICGNGNALLTAGNTFIAKQSSAVSCTGPGGAVFTGGTMRIAGADIVSALPMLLAQQGGTVDTQANTATFSGVISGPGGLTKTGTGTLVLTGNNTFTGGVILNGGTLSVGHNNALGLGTLTVFGSTLDIQNGVTIGNATDLRNNLTINVSAGATGAHAGAIFETGGSFGIAKIGAGTLILSGNNSYSGATNVDSGTLRAGAANVFGIRSATTVAGGATLDLAGFDQTLGSLAGAGHVLLGTARLTAGGDNTSTAFSGAIAGTGGVTKNGAGVLTLTGASTYTGATVVNGGGLIVNGSLASSLSLTVNGGAFVGGTGAVPSTLINNGGTIAPGNSIGTLTVAGDLTMAPTATYRAEVSPPTANRSDRINVSGAAVLGGTLEAVPLIGSFRSQTYTILNAAGGVTGTFSNLIVTRTFTPGARDALLVYDANNVYLEIGPGTIAPHMLSVLPFLVPVLPPELISSVAPRNPAAVAAGIDRAVLGGVVPPLEFDALFNFSGQGLLAALSQLDGEVATGLQPAANLSMGLFLNTMLDPFVTGRNGTFGAAMAYAPGANASPSSWPGLTRPSIHLAQEMDARVKPAHDNAGRAVDAYAASLPVKAPPRAPTFEQRWSVWGAAYGGRNRTDGDLATGSSDLTATTGGFAAGADYRVSPALTLGAAVAIGETHWNTGSLGSGESNLAQLGGYASARWNAFYLSGAVAGAWHNAETQRTVTVAGLDRLEADFDATAFGARVEGGWRRQFAGFGLTPYAAVQVQSVHTPAYSERTAFGSSAFALAYGSQTATDTRTELGLWADTRYGLANGALVLLRGRAAWVHDFNPESRINALFQTLPGSNFTVEGAAGPRDAALLSAAGELRLANGVALLARFDGELSGRATTYGGTGTIRYQW